MKLQGYWEKRAQAVADIQHQKGENYIRQALQREYRKAKQSIQSSIDSFYGKFAVNNEISLADARKLLSSNELDDFK